MNKHKIYTMYDIKQICVSFMYWNRLFKEYTTKMLWNWKQIYGDINF